MEGYELPAELIDNKNTHLYKKFAEYCQESTSIKIATGYFYISAFNLLYDDIMKVVTHPSGQADEPCITIVMGTETDQPTAFALESGYEAKTMKQLIKDRLLHDINTSHTKWDHTKLEKISELIANNRIQVMLYTRGKFHAKAYLFEGTQPRHSIAIVGSSNFTLPGIGKSNQGAGNIELNIATQDNSDEINRWFKSIYSDSEEFNKDLLTILKSSQPWINTIEHDIDYVSPTTLFLIMATSILQDTLANFQENDVLTEFQKIGVISAHTKIKNLRGVLISDAVGLGKTYIAIDLIKHHKYGKTLLIVPASLKDNWNEELKNNHAQHIPTMISLQDLSLLSEADIQKYKQYKFIIVDEAHRLRHKTNKNYKKLQQIIDSDPTKHFIFLTATPISNSIQDLENILNLFVSSRDLLCINPALSMSAFKDYAKIQLKILTGDPVPATESQDILKTIKKILAEVMVLRTRSYIATKYPHMQINGISHKFPPPPQLTPVECSFSPAYINIHNAVADLFKDLDLPHVRAANPSSPSFIGLYLSHIFKRLESSIHSFVCSLNNLHKAESIFKDNILKHGLKHAIELQWNNGSDINARIEFDHLDNEEFDTDSPADFDVTNERLLIIDKHGNKIPLSRGDVICKIDSDLSQIQHFLTTYIDPIHKAQFCYQGDPKIKLLIEKINENKKQKILIFSQYVDTVEYIYENLVPYFNNLDWIVGTPTLNKRVSKHTRKEKISMFAPIANRFSGAQIDILIASDTISEGVNLQDCSLIINYDLPWNPTRMIQRLGRVDRIGSTTQTKAINFLPDKIFDNTLGLLERIAGKIKIRSAVIGFENPLLTKHDPINHVIIGESDTNDIDANLRKLRHSTNYSDYEQAYKTPLMELVDNYDSSQRAFDLAQLITRLGLHHLFEHMLKNFKSNTVPYTIVDTHGKQQFTFSLYNHKYSSGKFSIPVLFTNHNGRVAQLPHSDIFDLLGLYQYRVGTHIGGIHNTARLRLISEWERIDQENKKICEQKNEQYAPGELQVEFSPKQMRIQIFLHDEQNKHSSRLDNTVDLDTLNRLTSWFEHTIISPEHLDQFDVFTNTSLQKLTSFDTAHSLKLLELFRQRLCEKYPIYNSPIPKRGDIECTLVCRGAFI